LVTPPLSHHLTIKHRIGHTIHLLKHHYTATTATAPPYHVPLRRRHHSIVIVAARKSNAAAPPRQTHVIRIATSRLEVTHQIA
jgi:hypothetical protein